MRPIIRSLGVLVKPWLCRKTARPGSVYLRAFSAFASYPHALWTCFWILITIVTVALYFGLPRLRARKARKIILKIMTRWVVQEFIVQVKSEFELESWEEMKRELVRRVNVFQERRKQARQLASPAATRLSERELSAVTS